MADKADRRRRQDALAKEQRCHEAARALQEAAAARARQEAACVSNAITRARQEDAQCQQLLAEQATQVHQEAAAARARQEAACMSDAIARARQDDDYDNNNDNNNNDDNDDNDEDYNDDDDNDDDAEDEYNDVTGQLKAYAATLFACVDATIAKIQAMDDGFEKQVAVQEKALADEANEQQRAAAREKALADKLHQAAAWEKALADKAKECREAVAHAKALAAKVLADKQGGQESAVHAKVFTAQALAIATSLPPRPTLYAGAVLSTLGGSLLPAVLLSPPSSTTGSPLQTVRRCSQPCFNVGRRHGPWAPNPQEHLLCGRRHWPRAPNQSTVNGWG